MIRALALVLLGFALCIPAHILPNYCQSQTIAVFLAGCAQGGGSVLAGWWSFQLFSYVCRWWQTRNLQEANDA